MMICATNGYIVSAMGPYLADFHNNVANITNHPLRTNQEGICDWMRSGDVMVADRDFRDILPLIQSFGWTTYMPAFLSKSTKEFTAEEANDNRKVTKIRWVVEAVNGRLKQYKYFDKVIPNTALPYIHECVQIVCALIHAFRRPFVQDTSNDDYIAQEMLARAKKKNVLESSLGDKEFLKLKKWEKMEVSSTAPNFPVLGIAELEDLTLGVFQIK
jgi:hypothetical protein